MPPKSTTTPAIIVIIAILTMFWSVACGCTQALGFMFTSGAAAIHDVNPEELDKQSLQMLAEAERQALSQERDETQHKHIEAAFDAMRKNREPFIAATTRVSESLRQSGVSTLLAGLTFCNLPFLVGAILILGRRRIGRTLLILTSTAILLLIAAVMYKLGGPIESLRVSLDEVSRSLLASSDAAALSSEARQKIEAMPSALMMVLTAFNMFVALAMSIWPLLTLLIVGLSKKINESCDQ